MNTPYYDGHHLEQWFFERPAEDFPDDGTYVHQFGVIRKKLIEIAKSADKGALLASAQDGDEEIVFLTDHGPEHIKRVCEKSTQLLSLLDRPITAYEAYCLLFALYLHDAGVVYGREAHEERCARVMDALGTVTGDISREKRIIAAIAACHSGDIKGDKDKISKLDANYAVNNDSIRAQLLAAVLRFADELADDHSRASRFLLDEGLVPPASEVYHAYSLALEHVGVNVKEIDLHFVIDKAMAVKTYTKKSKQVYLLDEMVTRTQKMHLERLYCMRFLQQYGMKLETVRVAVEVMADLTSGHLAIAPVSEQKWELRESGYPSCPEGLTYGLCGPLTVPSGKEYADDLAKLVGA